MLKLPVMVDEVSDSPEKTIDLAVQKRAELEKIALAEDEYIPLHFIKQKIKTENLTLTS